jgi:hypothetical protein
VLLHSQSGCCMTIRTARSIAGALALVVVSGRGAFPVEAQAGLAAVQGLRCTFPTGVAARWDAGGAPQAALRSASLVLRFESIDADAGTAQLRTGAVGTEVTTRLAEGYLHFMQAFRTGPLYTTTVFEAGSNNGRFKAVHSRHEFFTTALPGATSSPEQYYGECQVVK